MEFNNCDFIDSTFTSHELDNKFNNCIFNNSIMQLTVLMGYNLHKIPPAFSEILNCQLYESESKTEIVLEDYEYFLCNLKTLTPREMRIYELYADGKTTAEIAAIIGIKENTMKFHNKNIYSKLGVSSRKQFLRLAALKQIQDKKGTLQP